MFPLWQSSQFPLGAFPSTPSIISHFSLPAKKISWYVMSLSSLEAHQFGRESALMGRLGSRLVRTKKKLGLYLSAWYVQQQTNLDTTTGIFGLMRKNVRERMERKSLPRIWWKMGKSSDMKMSTTASDTSNCFGPVSPCAFLDSSVLYKGPVSTTSGGGSLPSGNTFPCSAGGVGTRIATTLRRGAGGASSESGAPSGSATSGAMAPSASASAGATRLEAPPGGAGVGAPPGVEDESSARFARPSTAAREKPAVWCTRCKQVLLFYCSKRTRMFIKELWIAKLWLHGETQPNVSLLISVSKICTHQLIRSSTNFVLENYDTIAHRWPSIPQVPRPQPEIPPSTEHNDQHHYLQGLLVSSCPQNTQSMECGVPDSKCYYQH